MSQHFYSNGKLLLTGEYLVLLGGEAIGLPLKMGQKMTVSQHKKPGIHWLTEVQDKLVFEGFFDCEKGRLLEYSDKEIGEFIENLLTNALLLNSCSSKGYIIENQLDFPFEWGFGSSSTLINNLAQWLNIDSFKLNKKITGGSGYDIACAKENNPILYQLKENNPHYHKVSFDPPFKNQLYFIYTGKKQSSMDAVKAFMKKANPDQSVFKKLSEINHHIIEAPDLQSFNKAIQEHEMLISEQLDHAPILKEQFPDFQGGMKSLGAWGGDFVLITWNGSEKELWNKLNKYQLTTLFKWNEIILNDEKHAREIPK